MRISEIVLLVWAIIATCLCVLIAVQAARIVTHVLAHTEQVRRNGHDHANRLLDRLMAKNFEEFKQYAAIEDAPVGEYIPPDEPVIEEDNTPADMRAWMQREFPEMVTD